jgi:hypothetical protein
MIFLILWLICGVVTGMIASGKGRSGLGWFLIGCILGIFGLILVAVLPSLKMQAVQIAPYGTSGPTKRCLDCGETVLEVANVCKHCGHRFAAG